MAEGDIAAVALESAARCVGKSAPGASAPSAPAYRPFDLVGRRRLAHQARPADNWRPGAANNVGRGGRP
jgi:hypothetical protein